MRNFRDKGAATRSLVPFGYGDGGGGPTREMLARARAHRRPGGLAAGARSRRRTRSSPPPRPEYADRAGLGRRAVPGAAPRPRTPRRRRPSRATGAASTCCARRSCGARPRPSGRASTTRTTSCDRLWKTVLLHQFHDILPGSSIAWVHREARETYAAVARGAGGADRLGAAALAGDGTAARCRSTPRPYRARRRARRCGAGSARRPRTRRRAAERRLVLDNGLLRVARRRARAADLGARPGGRPGGAAPGRANLLQLHPDLPNHWDAWDVDPFYRNTRHRPDRRRSTERRWRTATASG